MANTLFKVQAPASAADFDDLEVYLDIDVNQPSESNIEFPPGVSGSDAQQWRYKLSKLVNVNAVKNSIRQIFTWIPGERIINPEFGSNLRKYLYEPITEENQERIVAEIRQCALRWEPRIIVDRVVKATTTDDVENNTMKLDIYYRIKGLNDKQFMYQYEYSRSKYSYA